MSLSTKLPGFQETERQVDTNRTSTKYQCREFEIRRPSSFRTSPFPTRRAVPSEGLREKVNLWKPVLNQGTDVDINVPFPLVASDPLRSVFNTQ